LGARGWRRVKKSMQTLDQHGTAFFLCNRMFIERVDGTIGTASFRWELRQWSIPLCATSQDRQESVLARAWERLGALSVPGRRRLLAGLHYFHVACRLSRAGVTPGEFLAEAVLNFAKTLEVLFPPDNDGRTRDAARAKLLELGFSEVEIEADYIPAMALRNEIDVGHVDLSLFKPDQLALIHAYVEHAEGAFQTLLDRLLTRVVAGEFQVSPYNPGPPRPEAAAVVKRLQEFAGRYPL